jgi:hypothetical protein
MSLGGLKLGWTLASYALTPAKKSSHKPKKKDGSRPDQQKKTNQPSNCSTNSQKQNVHVNTPPNPLLTSLALSMKRPKTISSRNEQQHIQ